jgi:serine O-acetyltransferase
MAPNLCPVGTPTSAARPARALAGAGAVSLYKGAARGAARAAADGRVPPRVAAVAADRAPASSSRGAAAAARLELQLREDRLRSGAAAGPASPPLSLRAEAAAAALGDAPWAPAPAHLDAGELWAVVRAEASAAAAAEPVLASFLHTTVIAHAALEKGLAFLLANKLASPTLLGIQLSRLFREAYADDPELLEAAAADLQAHRERDPACGTYSQALLYFKGFQALQAHRVAHWMWRRGRRPLALALQSRVSEAFSIDIHPGAAFGRGILVDHATGIVVGETAVVGDNVSLLHHVTLGGSGVGAGVRHPTVGNGVLLGAGVTVLGPVVVGAASKVGAGSVVVTDLPPHCVAVGVPARVVRVLDPSSQPGRDMDQTGDFILDYNI